jgi:hypothetical protein
VVLFAAKILRTEEFLKADDLRSASGGLADFPPGFGEVFIRIDSATHLD